MSVKSLRSYEVTDRITFEILRDLGNVRISRSLQTHVSQLIPFEALDCNLLSLERYWRLLCL